MEDGKIVKYLGRAAVLQYKTDIGFRTLVESVNENMYIIPRYQRKYRWKKEQLTGLVESLLRGLPIPPIYTCRNEKNQLEILDGQQRVMSLFFYYIGYFLKRPENSFINFSNLETGNIPFKEALKKHYALEELHITFKDEDGEEINVDYAALPPEIKKKVDYTFITVIEIKIEKEEKKEEILQNIFANLNKGGSLLTKQEQRNGIYICDFYDMLQDFNRRSEKWRKLWGREDAKERDMEALLRFCALRKYISVKKTVKNGYLFQIDGYYSSYAEMLDRFSKEAMVFQNDEIRQYRESLEKFVELFDVNTALSSKASLMEGFYIVYEKLGIIKTITRLLLDSVQGTSEYRDNSAQRTVNIKKMNGRWNVVYELWNGFS